MPEASSHSDAPAPTEERDARLAAMPPIGHWADAFATPLSYRSSEISAGDRRTLPDAMAMPTARPGAAPAGHDLLELDSVPPHEGDEGSVLYLIGARRQTDVPVIEAPEPSFREPDPLVDMRDRLALGDYSGALIVAEGVLENDAAHNEAARCAETCRERLYEMYAARLGSLEHVPHVSVPPEQVRWLSLDHRAGFVLSCVDGQSTLEEILDVAGMPVLDALRILYELHSQRIISIEAR